MATQYIDGSFSDTRPLPRALEIFAEALEAETALAFHVGTPEQIDRVKERADLQTQIDELAASIKVYNAVQGGLIILPKPGDVELVCGKDANNE